MTNSWFNNRAARHSFFILVIGFILLNIAAVFIYSTMRPFVWQHFNAEMKKHEVVRIIGVAKILPPKRLPVYLKRRTNKFIWAKVGNRPLPSAVQIKEIKPLAISRWLNQHGGSQAISVLLPDAKWLNIAIHVPPVRWWLFGGLIAITLVFILFLIMLCAFAIKRLAVPLEELALAARNFGVNVDEPPIAESGSQEIQEVIHAYNQMQLRIKKLIGDRTQMLAAISHDLRTPITRLKLRAEYLENTEHYVKILADLTEMEKMINSVLTFAKEDAQTEIVQRFDLEALLDSLCDDMVDAGLKVEYQGYGKRLPFSGRIGVIKRALTNIISNAVQYGKIARVKLEKTQEQIRIIIDDEGPGIPPPELAKVFEPFYRVEQSRSRETGGTGLGLAIARDGIRAHGGDVELVNVAKGGLRVIITLPILQ